MAKQIRRLFDTDRKLSGVVEADETFIGGVNRKKSVIIGAVQRGGGLVAKVSKNLPVFDINRNIHRNVEVGSTLITDESGAYNNLELFYKRYKVNHSKKEWARGPYHTNTIEGFWSHLKRSIKGTYFSVSPKYLQSYLNEFSYRYSFRHSLASLFFPMVARASMPV